MSEDKLFPKVHNRRVHMANERTFLAWIRTSIGMMAFGFVVERFSIFVNQVSYFLGKEVSLPSRGYSAALGISLVVLGALMGVLSFIRYKKVERQINEDTYQPSMILDIMLALALLVIGIFLVSYLIYSV